MRLEFENNEETEEIIKLRVQLAKKKEKIVKYQQLITQISQFSESTSKIIEHLTINNTMLFDLGKQLGLNFAPYQANKPFTSIESKDFFPEILSKQIQVLKIAEKEGEFLKQINDKVMELIRQSQQQKKVHKQLQTKQAKYQSLLRLNQEQTQKIRKLDFFIKSKDEEMNEITRQNQELKLQSNDNISKLMSFQEKIKEFQNELLEKNICIEKLMGQLTEEEAVTIEKSNILQKCNKLIGSLELSDDEYISNYFRSNGMPLQVQRPLKNKYQMVFE